ncbi:MAG: type II toxin-antitoxin system RelE/ParE family toxin [Bacteroidetes bacterium]|nr:type II toxin-antitoxin system RelE/ParE family toxin [Bacteroidota bacterium]
MKLKVVVKPLAATQVAKAYEWYEKQLNGLGLDFLKEWEAVTDYIASHPESFQKKYKHFRQGLFNRFPYMAVYIYEVKERRIVIFTVISAKQKPSRRYKRK